MAAGYSADYPTPAEQSSEDRLLDDIKKYESLAVEEEKVRDSYEESLLRSNARLYHYREAASKLRGILEDVQLKADSGERRH